jgi:hypothetical protein
MAYNVVTFAEEFLVVETGNLLEILVDVGDDALQIRGGDESHVGWEIGSDAGDGEVLLHAAILWREGGLLTAGWKKT